MISPRSHLGDDVAAVVDGELGERVRERALRHLLTCPACRAEVEAARQVKARLCGLASAQPPPPAALADRLLAVQSAARAPGAARLPLAAPVAGHRRVPGVRVVVLSGLGIGVTAALALGLPRPAVRPPADPPRDAPVVEHAGVPVPVQLPAPVQMPVPVQLPVPIHLPVPMDQWDPAGVRAAYVR